MISDYRIEIRDWDLNRLTVFVLDAQTNVLDLHLVYNGISSATLMVDGDHPVAAILREATALDYAVQIWRKPPDSINYLGQLVSNDWALFYDGFHRTAQDQLTESNRKIFTSYSRSLEDMLARRSILYYTGTPQSKKSGPIETVMKEYVEENAGLTAETDADRLSNIHTDSHIKVATDAGGGPTWTGQRTYKKLIDVLEELGQWSQWGFWVRRIGAVSGDYEPDGEMTFECFEKIANDYRFGFSVAPVVFSPELGNMINPSFVISRTEELQSAMVLGQGEGDQRAFLGTHGTGINDSPWNDIEGVVDARQEELTAGLEVEGYTALYEQGPAESFTFEVVQSQTTIFGVHYNIGSLVSARYQNVLRHYRILTAEINVADGNERIRHTVQRVADTFNLEPGDLTISPAPPTTQFDAILRGLKNLSFRIHDMEMREIGAGFSGIALPGQTLVFNTEGVIVPASPSVNPGPPYFNVLDYGALGAPTDDSAAFQACSDAADDWFNTNGYQGIMYVPPPPNGRDYDLGSRVTINTPQLIVEPGVRINATAGNTTGLFKSSGTILCPNGRAFMSGSNGLTTNPIVLMSSGAIDGFHIAPGNAQTSPAILIDQPGFGGAQEVTVGPRMEFAGNSAVSPSAVRINDSKWCRVSGIFRQFLSGVVIAGNSHDNIVDFSAFESITNFAFEEEAGMTGDRNYFGVCAMDTSVGAAMSLVGANSGRPW